MSTSNASLADITQRATLTLIRELGIVDTMRFLNQFRDGNGDYTLDREQLMSGETVQSLVSEIRAKRSL